MYITVLKLSIIVFCEDAKLLLIIPKLSNVVAKLPTFVAPQRRAYQRRRAAGSSSAGERVFSSLLR
jgi:hypothetical protein